MKFEEKNKKLTLNEKKEYIEGLDLGWAEKYFSNIEYIDKKEENKKYFTFAEVTNPDVNILSLFKRKSKLEIYKSIFKSYIKNEDDIISILRDHEGKHAQLFYHHPKIFGKNILRNLFYSEETYFTQFKIINLVEEIICNSFQINEYESNKMNLSKKHLKELDLLIKKDTKKIYKIINNKSFRSDKVIDNIISILERKHKKSDDIWYGK